MKLISEMTDEELNEALAVEGMGWIKSGNYSDYCWVEKDRQNVPVAVVYISHGTDREYGVPDWRPATDLNQAWDVLVKFSERPNFKRLWLEFSGGTIQIAIHLQNNMKVSNLYFDLPRAICEAVLHAIGYEV